MKTPELINKNKLLEIMSKEQMRTAMKLSPSDEWLSGWVDCCIIWQDTVAKLPNEVKSIENLNSMKVPLELRPLFSKPKTEERTLDDVIDEVLYCKNCGAYICYPTEHNVKDEYKYCHHCGKQLDWDDVSMSEDYKKLEEIEK